MTGEAEVISKKISKTTEIAEISDSLFNPTLAMRKAKAKFLNAIKNRNILDSSSLSNSEISKLCKTPQIKNWLSEDGFKDWLLEAGETEERVEYLSQAALDRLESILLGDSSDKDAIQAAKMILEIKFKHSAPKEVVKDKAIENMTAEQLEQYIRKMQVKANTIDAVLIESEEAKAEPDASSS